MPSPEILPWVVALLGGAALVIGAVGLMLRHRKGPPPEDPRLTQVITATERLSAIQGELAGRLSQLGETQTANTTALAQRLQDQERQITKVLEERLADVGRRVGEGLQKSSEKQSETLQDLRARLAVIDAAQQNITSLSQRVADLQDILANKQARGAFGQTRMEDLITDALPPGAYQFQAKLGNGRIADCLLPLPNPPGPVCIDSKFPLEAWQALQAAEDDAARKEAARRFTADTLKHVKDIAERYLVPGETSDQALLFLPSEAIYAELHAHFQPVVEQAHRARVWIVSPTTLMAVLTTVRAILKDARMQEMAGLIQKEVRLLSDDMARLDQRVGKLATHFDQTVEDIRQVRISTDKIMKRGGRIEALDLEGEDEAGDLLPGTKG